MFLTFHHFFISISNQYFVLFFATNSYKTWGIVFLCQHINTVWYMQQKSAPVFGVNFCIVCRQLWCLQCFDAVGWAAGRASGL